MASPVTSGKAVKRRRLNFTTPLRPKGFYWGPSSKIEVISAAQVQYSIEDEADTELQSLDLIQISNTKDQPQGDNSKAGPSRPVTPVPPSRPATPTPENQPPVPPTPPFITCSFCKLGFPSRSERNKHIRRHHQTYQLL